MALLVEEAWYAQCGQEIGLTVAKLNPERQEVFADIECGSGSVSEFFCFALRKVYAVDINEKSRKKLAKFSNVEVVQTGSLKLAGNTAFKSLNPVFVIVGKT